MAHAGDEEVSPRLRGLRVPYGVDLLFTQPAKTLRRRLELLDPLTRVAVGAIRSVDHQQLVPSLQQSWWWRDAATTVDLCRHAVSVTEEPSTLPHRERFSKFQRLLAPVVEALEPAALHWIPTQQFVKPATFLEAIERLGYEYPAHGALNVRLYAIQGAGEDDMLMDTLGLGALGLWDLQCHFHDFDPSTMATWLLETARGQFLGDAPLRHRRTIAGADGSSRWRLREEDALMPPERVLLDIDPGPRWAAGRRL